MDAHKKNLEIFKKEEIIIEQDIHDLSKEISQILENFESYKNLKIFEYNEKLSTMDPTPLQNACNEADKDLLLAPKDIKKIIAKKTCDLNLKKHFSQVEALNSRIKFLEESTSETLINEKRFSIAAKQSYLKTENARFEKEGKYFANKKSERTIFEMSQREINNKLSTRVSEKFRDMEITRETLRNVSRCIRSKDDYKSKADFLNRARLFESESTESTESEKYMETSEGLVVLNAYIAANASIIENGKTIPGDPLIMKELFDLCEILVNSPLWLSEEKIGLALSFFLVEEFSYCYPLFHQILTSSTVRIIEKAEACKFLYYSGKEKYLDDIEKYTIEIINNTELSDDYRYQTIACYVSELGLKSKYLTENLVTTGVDTLLVTNLFKHFITIPCHPDKLILAYSFLLEQTADESIKPSVEDSLLAMAKSETFKGVDDPNKIIRIRADAADVLYRTSERHGEEAGRIITILGQLENEHEINKTVYTNSENIHLMNENMIEYLEKNFTTNKQKFVKIDEIIRDIEILCEKADILMNNRIKIRKSLDRIMLDPSKFTRFNITLTTVLIIIYNKIYSFDKKNALLERLLEELIDMSETCSSGHIKRLINVMTGFDSDLKEIMDISLQLEANVKARINKKIQDAENMEELVDGMDKDSENHTLYVQTVLKFFEDIRQELEKEFIEQGFLSFEKFSEKCTEILSKF